MFRKAFIQHPVVAIVVGFIIGMIAMAILTYMGYTSSMVCPIAKP